MFCDEEDTGVTVNVTIDGNTMSADLDFYTVTLLESVQYCEIKTESQNPIQKGKAYVFTVDVNERFVCGVPVVKANGAVMTVFDGKYTIVNVTEPTEINVVTVQHEWNDGEVGDGAKTYTCDACGYTKTVKIPNADGEVSATAEDVADVILELPATGTYTVKVTGEIDNDVIASISSSLRSSVGVSSLVNLDLSGTTGLVELGASFYECNRLSCVILPNSLKTIGNEVFWNCSNLKSITIPKNVSEISGELFPYCRNLTEIIVDSENEWYKSVDEKMILSKDGTVLVCYPSVSGEFTIPDGVNTIGISAFYCCDNLSNVTIPSEVENIGDNAFHRCKNLKSVTIESKIPPKLGGGVFDVFYGLKICVPPDAVDIYKAADGWSYYADSIIHIHELGESESYGDLIVYTCTLCGEKVTSDNVTLLFATADNVSSVIANIVGEATVIVKGEINNNTITTIKDNLIFNSSAMVSLDLSGTTGLTNIDFSYVSNIKSVIIPEGIKSTHDIEFSGCINLEKIYIPSSIIVKSTWNNFKFCPNVKFFVDENNPVFFASDDNTMLLFKNGEEIVLVSSNSTSSDITVPNGITKIGVEAFRGNDSLKNIHLPDSILKIDAWAFMDCKNLTRINIPSNLTTIEPVAFDGCENLTYFEVDNSNNIWSASEDHKMLLSKDGKSLFFAPGVSGDIVIPESVEIIEEAVFRYNTNIKSVKLHNKVTTIGYNAFKGCHNLETVNIPDSVTVIDHGAFWECYSLKSIAIPSTVEKIGDSAFAQCINIKFFVDSNNENYSASDDGKILLSKDGKILYSCPSASGDFTIPDGIVNIGECAFLTCWNPDDYTSGLTDVTIPDSVEVIEQDAFASCYNLSNAIISSGIKSIGIGAFYSCYGLESITIKAIEPPNLGNSAFEGCSSLNHIYVPAESVTAYKNSLGWAEYAQLITTGSVTLDIKRAELWSGETIQLLAKKNPPSITGDVDWTSDDTTIASVSDTGLVSAVGVGTAVIKASFAGNSVYCTIFVKPKVTSITLFNSSLELAVGDTFTFSEDDITITPSDALIKETSWASSNPIVADVTDGIITAHSLGTARITYTVDGVKASCEVTVKESVSSDDETGNVDVTIY